MPATVLIFKVSDGPQVTDSGGGTGITNMNWLATSGNSTLSPANFPITRPATATAVYSYENWHYMYVSAMSTSTKINNIQFWQSAGVTMLSGNYSNMWINSNVMSGVASIRTNYSTAVATSGVASGIVQAVDPGTANVGISGSVNGTNNFINQDHKRSDFVVTQVGISSSVPVGQSETKTFTFQYDEQ